MIHNTRIIICIQYHSFIPKRTHTHTNTIDWQNKTIKPPWTNAKYYISTKCKLSHTMYTHTHIHTSNICLYMTVCHSLSPKKKFYSGLLNILFIYYKKKIIDVMVHIGDHKNQNQWVFIFSRRMKNSLIEFNGIR